MLPLEVKTSEKEENGCQGLSMARVSEKWIKNGSH